MMRMRLYSCLITVALLCYPYVALAIPEAIGRRRRPCLS